MIPPEAPTLFDVTDDVAPPAPQVRVRMSIAYDGSAFHGFAIQPGLRTVAGILTEALEKVLRHRVVLTGAGRTDRGVHAHGQVVSFDTSATRFDPAHLQRVLNKLCGPALAVWDVQRADAGFDARFSARSRAYRYIILNRPVPDPMRAATAWHVAAPLDLAALRIATDPLIGEHDFSSFCRRPKAGQGERAASLVREVFHAGWVDEGVDGLIRFEISANAFCHQMVRSLVGTLVDMGLGRLRAGEMLSIMRSADRARAGNVAPPHGLSLWEVNY